MIKYRVEPSDLNQLLIEKIHATEGQFALAVTGGGTTAITDLLSIAGASRTLLEATIPYHTDSLKSYLGAVSSPGCNAGTARAMAMQSWLKASSLCLSVPVFGLGCTAAIATDRNRRGEDRCHLAIQSSDATLEITVTLDKRQSREEQEAACNQMIITSMAQTLGIDVPDPEDLALSSRHHRADPAWVALLNGTRRHTAETVPEVVFPGAFNPLHDGHREMIAVATRLLGKEVCPEISISNVDKPPLDYLEMHDRQQMVRDYPLVFTNAPTFAEKSELFPGATFIVGLDTIARIADSKYYSDDTASRDAAIRAMASRGNQFLVFGRLNGARFETLDQADLPGALEALCTPIAESDFRVDISSTELRNKHSATRTKRQG